MKHDSKHSVPSLVSLRVLGQRSFLSILPVAVAALVGLGVKAHGASGTWSNTGAFTTATWSTTSNWQGGTVPGTAAGDVARIVWNMNSNARSYDIVNTSRTLGQLLLSDNATAYNNATITSSGTASITFDNSGSGAVFSQNTAANSATSSIAVPVSLADNLSLANSSTAAGQLRITGVISAVSGSRTITNNSTGSGQVVLTGAISNGGGTVSVTQNSGSSMMSLTGSNSYTGATTISSGTLRLGAGSTTGVLSPSSSISVSSGATFAINRTNTVTQGTDFSSAAISGSGGFTQAGSGTTTLNVGNTYTGATTISAGTLKLGAGSTTGGLSSSSAISVAAGATLAIDRSNTVTQGTDFSAGAITGSGRFTQAGSGRTILNAANTYSGATAVNAGTLEVAGAGSINSSSSLTVAAGANLYYNSSTSLTVAPVLAGNGSSNSAVLGGAGTIGASITLNDLGDTLSPGNSPGTLSFSTSQTWSSFTYNWELNNWAASVAGTDYDQIAITGGLTLDVAGAYNLNLLSLTSGNLTGDVANFTEPASNKTWSILTTTGGITNFDSSKWTINTGGFTSSPTWTGSWSIGQTGNNLVLTYTPVPEPAAALLGGLGTLLLLRRRRI